VRALTAARIIAYPVRAAVCHRFEQPLTVEDVMLSEPDDGELTVRVHACGVCHSDVTYMDGLWGGELPAVYGHEVAGVVTAAGPGVQSPAIGDHVVVSLVRECGTCFHCRRGEPTQCEGSFSIDSRGALRSAGGKRLVQGLRVGGFAESVTVHASQAVPIPDTIALESACLLGCAVATGFGAVRNTARVEPGASVAIVGVGGVGINSVQAARIAGATRVIALDVSDARLGAARDLGATDAVRADGATAVDAVRSLTAGRGADFTIIASGNRSAIELGLRLPRRGGTVVMVGMTANGETVAINPGDIADSALRILGCKLGAVRPRTDVPALIELYRSGELKLDELVTARFPLESVNDAVAAARRGDGMRTVVTM
jgi:Zn-dependent alcohol dehydrogenase